MNPASAAVSFVTRLILPSLQKALPRITVGKPDAIQCSSHPKVDEKYNHNVILPLVLSNISDSSFVVAFLKALYLTKINKDKLRSLSQTIIVKIVSSFDFSEDHFASKRQKLTVKITINERQQA